ncbi:MAG: hydroxyacylglutathione hydrolase [Methylobacteriaceae bacterium]|nr:hydroxyacylglutathione hydrolase [Methylobacteriaceae bacterium]MBV9247096.1 hydroxyacylglutathione hydrolase [Methylobacteriaceae bacterium]MBV9637414.1 hydroxyacylglutathione hydrolase [Methylobacteriaceae bacterium]
MPARIHQFICRSDNFGVLVHDPVTGTTAAIDAPDGAAVLAALDAKGWALTDVLVTHHHGDHVEGIPALKRRFPNARVVAPAKDKARIPGADAYVAEGDDVMVGSYAAKIIATPGHTTGHIVYWFEEEDLLFAGDTLFAMGCGRVLETSMLTMWESLLKLARLPGDCQVYCGHEYTLANARFALTVDPSNDLLRQRAKEVEALRSGGKMTLPTTISLELATNPFLRAGDRQLQAAVGMPGADPGAVFAEIRERKNRF